MCRQVIMEVSVSSNFIKINHKILKFCKYIYLAVLLAYGVMCVLSIFKLFLDSFSVKNVLSIIDLFTLAARSYFVFYLFSKSIVAFESWVRENFSELKYSLRKVVTSLYWIAVIDAVAIVEKFFFQLDYGTSASVFKANDSSLYPLVSVIESNKAAMSNILDYMVPRPTGIAAFIIALLLLQIIAFIDKKMSSS
jgi:hypothetical protein